MFSTNSKNLDLNFPQKNVIFSGYQSDIWGTLCQRGVETDPRKIAALTTWPTPKNFKELKAFLGLAGHYRRFIRDYSKIARPLNNLTVGCLPPKSQVREI